MSDHNQFQNDYDMENDYDRMKHRIWNVINENDGIIFYDLVEKVSHHINGATLMDILQDMCKHGQIIWSKTSDMIKPAAIFVVSDEMKLIIEVIKNNGNVITVEKLSKSMYDMHGMNSVQCIPILRTLNDNGFINWKGDNEPITLTIFPSSSSLAVIHSKKLLEKELAECKDALVGISMVSPKLDNNPDAVNHLSEMKKLIEEKMNDYEIALKKISND